MPVAKTGDTNSGMDKMKDYNTIVVKKRGHYFIFRFRTVDEFNDQLMSFYINPDLDFDFTDLQKVACDFVQGLA